MIINGIEYERIPQPPKSESRKGLLTTLAMGFVTPYDLYYQNHSRPKPMPFVDLEKEFELIQMKKSKLSARERKAVEHAFNRVYRPIN